MSDTNSAVVPGSERALRRDLSTTRTASALRLLLLVAVTATLVGSLAAVLFVGALVQLGISNR